MKHILLSIYLLLMSGCSIVPVFEGDYLRNQKEISNQFEETKEKIAENAGIIHTAITEEESVATVITSENSRRMKEWAAKPVEFSKPTQGMDLLKIISMIVMGGGALGGVGAFKKISSLKDTVKAVAGMDGEAGKAEANKRGVTV